MRRSGFIILLIFIFTVTATAHSRSQFSAPFFIQTSDFRLQISEPAAFMRAEVQSEKASVTLKVVPPWYLNGWIVIPSGGALLVILMLYLILASRYYAKRRKVQELREQMRQQEEQARKELEATNAELESALRTAEWGITTIRGLAHSLKNSSDWIDKYCTSIKSHQVSSDAHAKIQRIQRVSHRMSQTFKKLFEATGNPQYRPFNLASIMSILTLQVVQGNPDWKTNIQLNKQYESKIDIIADREKLILALRDIIFNACEAMEEQGGTLTIKMTSHNEEVHLEIQDMGRGIPEADLDKVFNAGYTSKPEGTGLGLWIAKQIIEEMHRGQISLFSQEGVGTVVAIKLPKNGKEIK